MHRTVLAALALPLCVAALWASDDKDKTKPKELSAAAKQVSDVETEYKKAESSLSNEFKSAKDDQKPKILARYKELLGTFSNRFLKVAEEHPKDPAAFDALIWIETHQADGLNPAGERAAEMLALDHARDPRINRLSDSLARAHSPAAEKLLRAVLAENPKKETRASACLALAQALQSRSDTEAMHGQNEQAAQTSKESERYFEQVARDYGDVKIHSRDIKDEVKGDLFELHSLAVGKTAPDIEGKDSSGKSFRLSDYRGKVVILDFWARW